MFLGLSLGNIPHMRLRDMLLVKPNSSQDFTARPQAWYSPPFLTNPNQTSRMGAEAVSTPAKIVAYLKSVYQPAVQPGKRPAELLWVTTTLTNHPVDDSLPRYKAWETEASLYVSIDVLDHHTGIRHSTLEGHTAVAARGLLLIVACSLHHLAHVADEEESTLDPPSWKTLSKASPSSRQRRKASQLNSARYSATRLVTRPTCRSSVGLSST